MQCSTEGKECLTTPRAPPLPGYNHNSPFPLEDAMDRSHLDAKNDQESNADKEEDLNPAAAKNQEGNEGGAQVLCTDAALTQEPPLGVTMDQKLPSSPGAEPDKHVCIHCMHHIAGWINVCVYIYVCIFMTVCMCVCVCVCVCVCMCSYVSERESLT